MTGDGATDLGFTALTFVFTCEGAPIQGRCPHDDFGDECNFSHAVNRGTEYDHARMWWDLRTDEDLSAANPHSWNADGDGRGAGCPADRLHDAALTVGGASMQGGFDTWAATNGADR